MMSKNPYDPPQTPKRSPNSDVGKTGKQKLHLALKTFLMIVVFSIVTGLAFTFSQGYSAHARWLQPLLGILFLLCPIIAVAMTVASAEKRYAGIRHPEAVKRGVGFVLLIIALVVAGYVGFATSCTGTTIALMDTFPGPPRTYTIDRVAGGIISGFATFFGCALVHALHLTFRGTASK
jgi:hypothetical protein